MVCGRAGVSTSVNPARILIAMTSADKSQPGRARRAWRIWMIALTAIAGIVALFLPGPEAILGSSAPTFVGNASCVSCHEEQSATFLQTAHARTSSVARADTVFGSFRSGSNMLLTANPDLHFRMDATASGFTQTAVRRESSGEVLSRTESFDIVVGSGRKGQTYLYWEGDALLELPVSYWAEEHKWVNSPGYIDGEAKFDRPIKRRCLECHATSFEWSGPPENVFKRDSLVLGISCEKCHGPGSKHVELYRSASPARPPAEPAIINPSKLTRERQIDLCELCHAGLGIARTPPLSFVAGDALADHVTFPRQEPGAHIDVHASQVQLLERSRCFTSSAQMTCTTCHDVHRPERDLATFARKCLECHQVESCGEFPKRGLTISTQCVDCHMPLERTVQIMIEGRSGGTMQPKVRNHQIAIYPEEQPR
jgi:hypothetical protein